MGLSSGTSEARAELALASAARTVDATAEFDPGDHGVVEAVLVATALAATPSVTLNIQAWNEAAQAWETLITSAAIVTAAPTTSYVQVNPYTAAVTNVSAQRALRPRMRVFVDHSDTDSITYSVTVYASR